MFVLKFIKFGWQYLTDKECRRSAKETYVCYEFIAGQNDWRRLRLKQAINHELIRLTEAGMPGNDAQVRGLKYLQRMIEHIERRE